MCLGFSSPSRLFLLFCGTDSLGNSQQVPPGQHLLPSPGPTPAGQLGRSSWIVPSGPTGALQKMLMMNPPV